MKNLAATNPAKANPTTQATVAAAGGGATGGLLPAGNYFFSYSWVDAFGETTIGTSRSTVTAVGATNIPRVTIPALPTGVQSANIYVTPVGGAAGTEQLYATGITTTTFDCPYAAKADAVGSGLPTVNTTGWPAATSDLYGMTTGGNDGGFETSMIEFISSILSGNAMSEREMRMQLVRNTAIAKARYTVFNEIATLLWASLGTVGYSSPTGGIGMSRPVRTLA